LAILDSIGIPIVGGVDALLIAVATLEPTQAYVSAICATAGSLVGSLVLFSIARKGGHMLLAKHTSHGTGLHLRNWFERYGLLTVFIPALSPLPMPLKIPVFCAGALEVRTRSFVAVILLARVIRYFALASLGQRYGRYTFTFLKGHWMSVTVILLALCGVAIALLRLVNRNEPEIPPEPAVVESD
jgi:membrane protein YqaA with SNARE-associated domain